MDQIVEIVTSPWKLVGALAIAYALHSAVSYFTRPKNYPPFYAEPGYIPWLGSLPQFAIGPREFLQRAAMAKGDVFTIQLFGKSMTFLFGSEGHAHFFKQREHVFDIREAYAMTVTTFGPGVCYDVSQSKMAEQFAFFKNGLNDAAFVKYMELVQDEVSTFFTQEWGDEGEADLLQSLSDLYTLTSSRCLLGDEIRQRWKDSGMAEHYCTFCRHLKSICRFSFSPIRTFPNSKWRLITPLFPFFSSSRGFLILTAPNVSMLATYSRRFSKRLSTSALRRKKIPTIRPLPTFYKC